MSSDSGLPTSSSTSDALLLLKTATFAAEKHKDQRRKNTAQTPYINHPLQVAHLIAAEGSSLYPNPPVHILQAAMLHDTVEDTDTSREELVQVFGEKVAAIVMEVTDDKNLPKAARKQAQIDKAPHKSGDAKHIKLADKLANLTDLSSPGGVPVGWTVQRIQEYFQWGKKVTDGCKEANPGLAAQLDKLYRTATFEFEGRTYKAHPDYS
ncbi:hypothetical protein MNV49_004162 [Pseudohyphozyma bogoriensis]|nr:hypothetical protein MNV49_004162 [Pseudohyphozyma bogoriensis]